MPDDSARFLSSVTGGEWATISDIEDDDGEITEGCGQSVRRFLVDLLRTDNLIILTGLGSSLCVTTSDGMRLLPTMNDLWDAAKAKTGVAPFQALLKEVKYPGADGGGKPGTIKKDIELLLSQCHVAAAFTESESISDFIHETEKLIVDRCQVLTDDISLETHQAFLRRVARRSTRLPRTKIFTTNYDLCFETAASRNNFVAVDGFSHTMPQEFDASHFMFDFVRRQEDVSAAEYVPNVFHLFKLHGSVDWDKSSGRIRRDLSPKEPVLVFPRYSKFETSYEHPFFEVMARFLAALRQPKTTLLVIGFGFADKHLTNPVMAAIRSNVGLRLLVVDPILETEKRSAVAGTIESLIQGGDHRLALLAAKFEEFVPLLPDLVTETELERHTSRVRGAAE